MSYSKPQTAVYRFPAASLSSEAVIGRAIGPKGKRGVVTGVAVIITTAVTVAATSITVGVDDDVFATLKAPVSAIGSGHNNHEAVIGHEIPQDSVLKVSSGGEATAGAGDVLVSVSWY